MISAQIIGTNAKGTVSIYLAALFSASGLKTGLFTSPHLARETERIRIDGAEIPRRELDRLMALHADAPNVFTAYTLAARDRFADEGAQAAVWECGLGGRLDPTTSLPRDAVILTRIGLDHTEILGDTIEKIAAEKCAAIPIGGLVIAQPQCPGAQAVIKETCGEKGARLIWVRPPSPAPDGSFESYGIADISLRAPGLMQPLGAATALCAYFALGLGAPAEALRGALCRARVPGRIEYFPERELIVDGGHNEDALCELSATLCARFPGRGFVFLAAAMRDKDVSRLVRLAGGSPVVAVCAEQGRGRPAAELARLFENGVSAESPAAGLALAQEIAKKTGALAVACGSFYLAGEVLSIIGAI